MHETLKPYHILLLGCILFTLLLLNSNYINSKRNQMQLDKEQKHFFNRIISKRYLQDPDDSGESEHKSKEDTDKVCDRGTQELRDYYKTGDFSKIGLDDKPITCKEKDEEYMKALKKILKKYVAGDDSNENTEGDADGASPGQTLSESGDEGDSDIKESLIEYGKHILPLFFFLAIGLLCIPGWLICCFCCCCNCCCCCCCKKPRCKCPCFIFTYVFYALAVIVCIYGLSQSNQIFEGIADSECSFLRFVDELLGGETKETLPKWAGIDGIITILEQMKGRLTGLRGDTIDDINNHIDALLYETTPSSARNTFLNEIKKGDTIFKDDSEASGKYNKVYDLPDKYTNAKYLLDIIHYFGHFESDNTITPALSVTDLWVTEYKEVSQRADSKLEEAKGDFNSILGDSDTFDGITQALDDGKKVVEDLKSNFQIIQDDVAQSIVDYSEVIDDYGRLGFKLVFTVLGLMNVALAIFVFFICFFSGKMCTNCCCCRCIFKCATHLLWNLLAFLMILTFIIGFLFTFIGQIGSDVMTLISYIVSEDNIGDGKENLLVDQLAEAKKYISKCINGDGVIMDELGIGDQLENFDGIKEAEIIIDDVTSRFNEIIQNMQAYKEGIRRLKDRWEDLKTSDDFGLILQNPEDFDLTSSDAPSTYLKFNDILIKVNNYLNSIPKSEQWTYDCAQSNLCTSPDPYTCYHPKTCLPNERDWYTSEDLSDEFKLNVVILNDIKNSLGFSATDLGADDDAPTDPAGTISKPASYSGRLKQLRSYYIAYLQSYINVLGEVKNAIKQITDLIKQYTGNEGGLFSFVNCNFIGKNLKVMLNNLGNALGTKVYTVGVCLLIVGCALALSISSTILLIIVINGSIEQNKKEQNEVPEYKLNSGGRIIQYQS